MSDEKQLKPQYANFSRTLCFFLFRINQHPYEQT